MTTELINPTQRLTRILKEAGGVSIKGAMKDVQREMSLIKGDVRKELEKRLGVVNEAYAAIGEEESPESIQALYDATNNIVGLGAFGGAPHFDTAAMCLCIMLDKMMRFAGYDPQPVAVHVNAFPLIFKADPVAAENIVEGLKKMGAGRRFAEPEEPGAAA